MPTNTNVNLEEKWFEVNELINTNIDTWKNIAVLPENRHEILDTIRNTIIITNDNLNNITNVNPVLINLSESLKKLLNTKHIDLPIRFTIVGILIALHEKDLIQLEADDKFITVICFLVENCCTNFRDKKMIPFIKKLRKLIINILKEKFKSKCLEQKSKIIALLEVLMKEVSFCTTENGREIVSHLVCFCKETLKEFQSYVKKLLISCKKTEAFAFGSIYFRIWELIAEEDTKKYFEEECIQWLMERAFTLNRNQPSVKNLSFNVQSLLFSLYCSRKQGKFSKVITNLYTPLIWKYLSSNNNIHRANAAEIFMNVYPLEKPGERKKGYSTFLRKQHEEMLALLDDDCPLVRIIAIKGICSNMKYFWITFQNGTAEQVIEKFITVLIMDGSYADVRKSVYQGLTQLLENDESHKLLKGVLPSLGGFIHDENQSVRQAFILMLLKIKSLKESEIKYWQIVDLYNISARLADDSPKNRQLIVKLIFSSFFNDQVMDEQTYQRLCKFISVNATASRYLAMYSKEVLEFENAVRIMCTILLSLRRHLLKIIGAHGDENKQPVEHTRQRRKLKSNNNILTSVENVNEAEKGVLNEMSVSVPSSLSVSSSSLTNEELNSNRSTKELTPYIAHGLFDFVGMLWLIHGKTLSMEQNKHHLDKLHTCAIKCLPLGLRYFKETHAFFGALNLICMIPLSKLNPQTIEGNCMSKLRQMDTDTPLNEIHCIIHALCMWNRGADIIELVIEWLNEAFRSENLHESYLIKMPRKRRVKLPHLEPKPKIALKILDVLFSSPADQQYLFPKITDDLFNLLNYLSRVKVLVLRIIENEDNTSELLDDKFLISCLTQYGNLLIMFNLNKIEIFDFWKVFIDYLEWSKEIWEKFYDRVSYDEELTNFLIVDVIKVPLIQSLNLVALGICEDAHLIKFIEFYLYFLSSNYGIHFVDLAIHFIKELILYSKFHHENNRNTEVMILWFPRLLENILILLTDKVQTKEILLRHVKNPSLVRKNLIFVYALTLKLYPKLFHLSPSYKIMKLFCESLINVVLFPIKECEVLNVDQNVKNLPFVGNLLATIFISQVELSSAFLYVLKNIISNYSEQDGLLLLATASILYTFAFNGGKTQKSELLKVVKITYNKILRITAEQADCLQLVVNHERTMGDRTIIDIEDTNELAVKEIGKYILQTVVQKLGGSLS